MIAVEYRVTVDRRAEWELSVEIWRRDELRSQAVKQSADTVAGRRAEPKPKDPRRTQ